MTNLLKNIWKIRDEKYVKYVKIPRFIISGGTATLVNLGILFLLTHFLSIWYLISSIVSFVSAFFVSFSLQKFWTFRDNSKENMHKQAIVYFLIMILGLVINTLLIFFMVEFATIHYLLAQIISGVVIALLNFVLYHKFVFKK